MAKTKNWLFKCKKCDYSSTKFVGGGIWEHLWDVHQSRNQNDIDKVDLDKLNAQTQLVENAIASSQSTPEPETQTVVDTGNSMATVDKESGEVVDEKPVESPKSEAPRVGRFFDEPESENDEEETPPQPERETFPIRARGRPPMRGGRSVPPPRFQENYDPPLSTEAERMALSTSYLAGEADDDEDEDEEEYTDGFSRPPIGNAAATLITQRQGDAIHLTASAHSVLDFIISVGYEGYKVTKSDIVEEIFWQWYIFNQLDLRLGAFPESYKRQVFENAGVPYPEDTINSGRETANVGY